MKTNKVFVFFMVTVLMLGLTASCKRDGITEPEVSGPSSFATLLKLETNRNAIFAGNTQLGAVRDVVNITAKLNKYDGTPVANRTVFFEIANTAGQKLSVGYFDGGYPIKSASTDSSGTIRLNYFGPFAEEISSDTQVNIWATVSWLNNEMISEHAPVVVIKDFGLGEGLALFSIVPDVLYCDEGNPQAEITAEFTYAGRPLSGQRVYFTILGDKPGTFDDNLRATFRETDGQGVAKIKYVGPTMNGISGDTSVFFRVQLFESVFWEGGDPGGHDERGNPLLPSLALRLIKKR